MWHIFKDLIFLIGYSIQLPEAESHVILRRRNRSSTDVFRCPYGALWGLCVSEPVGRNIGGILPTHPIENVQLVA